VANTDAVFVQVNPTMANAGSQVQITASCGENVSSATVSSTAFGSETMQVTNGTLSASVTIPANAPGGQIGVRLACPTGNQATTTITIVGASPAASVPGPNTGGGFLAGNEDTTEVASEPADRTPLVWMSVGLASLVAAGVVAVRTKQRASVRSDRLPPRDDQGTAGPR
jgi:hypothetical protein